MSLLSFLLLEIKRVFLPAYKYFEVDSIIFTYFITMNKIKYKKTVEVIAIAERGTIIPELSHLKNLILLFIILAIQRISISNKNIAVINNV